MNAIASVKKSFSSNILCMIDMLPPGYKYLALDALPGKTGTSSKDAMTHEYKSKDGETFGREAALVRPIQGTDRGRLQHQRSRKGERGWEHSPDYVLDIEKTASILSFSSDEEVTGLITMEDVIEELLQV